ncbi:MAG: hypothetical protein IJU81_04205 [Bacteroidales bacterium]|nr:hypothetical protein [Bacteroidales bacterium]
MKRLVILIAGVALLFAACRKEADYVPYVGENSKLAYSTYTEQFQYIWKAISTGYVFWDVDTVDWDAAYDRFLPRFEALDSKYDDSGYVRTSELAQLYLDMMGKMRDHHMLTYIKNMHPAPYDQSPDVNIRPGSLEVQSRDYYIENTSAARAGMRAFLAGIERQYNVAEHDSTDAYIDMMGSWVHIQYCLFVLSDGRKVPYLWMTNAAITPIMREQKGSAAYRLIDSWLSAICNTPRSQLAGFILDNRANGGGYQDDLDYLVGPFLNEKTEIFRTRYKEGPGRLEHSVWCPYYQEPNPTYHRDITAEGIPYIVLTDILSVSMGEIEPTVIKELFPTAHTIGERTYGGTGPLQPGSVDLNYGGPFGDRGNYNHYVYTSTFEALMGGRVCEGEGLVPDEEVLRRDALFFSFKPQLDAAFAYLMRQNR